MADVDFATLVEQIPAVIYLDPIDENDESIYVSPQLEKVLGYPTSQWLEDDEFWFDHVHAEDQERVWDAYEQSMTTGRPLLHEYRMLASDGSVVWIEERATIVPHDDGSPKFIQGVLLDITERKRAESLKDTLLHAVSHDLKSPLAAMMGTVSTLLHPDLSFSAEDRDHLLESILRGAKRMDQIVSDLLDLARMEQGLMQARREAVDLADVLSKLSAELSREIDGADERVQISCDELIVRVDRAMVERIVENLVRNALRHSPDGHPVRISATPVEGGAMITVEDDGPGVPEKERERIFEPFTRLDDRNAGAGIGLALVREFAEIHGGRAWVDEATSGGASFKVTLPSAR